VNQIKITLKSLLQAYAKDECPASVILKDKEYVDRIIITAEPEYLAKFTSTPQIISYQRRFMNAAYGHK